MSGDRRISEYSFREHLELIRTRPGMYGLDGSYGNYVTYLCGYDEGARGTALLGFREWLLLRLGRPSSLVWPSLIAEQALPGVAHAFGHRNLDEQQNRVAVEALFRFLGDFLRDRDTERDGLRSIFRDYSLRFAE
ncbi:hypothetical protein [Streptomyces sp. ISID311]|uniref:hypothetical protein n=1 Tax=Streptomyces sp. ISID311 TaxID=2601673 RepID=UPI0011BD3B0F|nr:hypothetical protein [Streptomyces sp. ISID311]TXC95895.1 hypothetical protein FS847_20950 [Streptomyces sp. ISID311]